MNPYLLKTALPFFGFDFLFDRAGLFLDLEMLAGIAHKPLSGWFDVFARRPSSGNGFRVAFALRRSSNGGRFRPWSLDRTSFHHFFHSVWRIWE